MEHSSNPSNEAQAFSTQTDAPARTCPFAVDMTTRYYTTAHVQQELTHRNTAWIVCLRLNKHLLRRHPWGEGLVALGRWGGVPSVPSSVSSVLFSMLSVPYLVSSVTFSVSSVGIFLGACDRIEASRAWPAVSSLQGQARGQEQRTRDQTNTSAKNRSNENDIQE